MFTRLPVSLAGFLLPLQILNEVVVDRGYAGTLCNLNLFVDSLHVTAVQGDGEEFGFGVQGSGNPGPRKLVHFRLSIIIFYAIFSNS